MSRTTEVVYAVLPHAVREQLLRGKISRGGG